MQVLDARDPLGCRTKKVEEYVLQQNKKLVLVLNKIDLVPKENVEAWLRYLRHEFPTVAFKACTQSQRRNLAQLPASASSSQIQSSGSSFGAETLVKLLKNYACNQGSASSSSILVGVIGYPNVGKSSLINSIVRSRVCNVGATAGITQTSQQIHLDRQVKLLDCPGIVFSQGTRADRDLLLRNCVAVEDIVDPIAAVSLILARCGKATWKKVYGITDFSSSNGGSNGKGGDVSEFLLLIAKKLGRLKKGGIADLESAAITVLRDWNMGKIPFYSVPPKVHPNHAGSSSIVSAFSKEFRLEEISAEESLLLSESADATAIIPDNSHRFYVKMGVDVNDDDVDMEAEISSMSEDDYEDEDEEENEEVELKVKEKVPKMTKKKTAGGDNQFYDFGKSCVNFISVKKIFFCLDEDMDMGGVSVSDDDDDE